MRHFQLRRDLLDTARRMNSVLLNQGTSGNVSARTEDGFLVTPTGVPYDEMSPEHLVEMRMDGSVRPGQLAPSSEWRFHRDIYLTREEAGAVVHAHPMFCTTLACLGRGIPPFHYMVAVAGGDSIRCADYATFGTEELSQAALAALEGRRACLLAHHGMIAFGATAAKALALAAEVETLAAQYWRVLQIGEPRLLPPDEMARVIEKFRTYGKQPPRGR